MHNLLKILSLLPIAFGETGCGKNTNSTDTTSGGTSDPVSTHGEILTIAMSSEGMPTGVNSTEVTSEATEPSPNFSPRVDPARGGCRGGGKSAVRW